MLSSAVFVYHQDSGEFFFEEKHLGRGYSGQPPHVNASADEWIHEKGPIPRGDWMLGRAIDSAQLGPVTIPLVAFAETRTFGRDGFYVHGDSVTSPGFASHGCVILERRAREVLALHPGATVRVV